MDHSYLTSRLEYDPGTGAFTWRKRHGNDRESHRWNARYAGAEAGSVDFQGYRIIRVDFAPYSAHRLAWFYVNRKWPLAEIDHINGLRSDNRICNLREADAYENSLNRKRRADNVSGYTGVYWHKDKRCWIAQIAAYGRKHTLGRFPSREAAFESYIKAQRRLHAFQPLPRDLIASRLIEDAP